MENIGLHLPEEYKGKYLLYFGEESDNTDVLTQEILDDRDEDILPFDTYDEAHQACLERFRSNPGQPQPARIYSPDGKLCKPF